MKTTCFLCEKKVYLEDDSLIAKKLRNHPLTAFLCDECRERIKQKTLARLEVKRDASTEENPCNADRDIS